MHSRRLAASPFITPRPRRIARSTSPGTGSGCRGAGSRSRSSSILGAAIGLLGHGVVGELVPAEPVRVVVVGLDPGRRVTLGRVLPRRLVKGDDGGTRGLHALAELDDGVQQRVEVRVRAVALPD